MILSIARWKPHHRFGMANGGWAYNAYPDLETLDAGKRITVAEMPGPGVITNFHSTPHGIYAPDMSTPKSPAYYARGVVLEVYYNGSPTPSVCVPIGDFHAFHAGGEGSFLGQTWGVCTDEPVFDDVNFVLAANNEFRLDGEERPRADATAGRAGSAAVAPQSDDSTAA